MATGSLARAARAFAFRTKVAIPPPSNRTPAATMTVVLVFDHAISFNAPLIRVKVEVEAVAPSAIATAVAVFARTAGAADCSHDEIRTERILERRQLIICGASRSVRYPTSHAVR